MSESVYCGTSSYCDVFLSTFSFDTLDCGILTGQINHLLNLRLIVPEKNYKSVVKLPHNVTYYCLYFHLVILASLLKFKVEHLIKILIC